MNASRNSEPLYARVANAVEELIRSGVLRPGERVPSVRRASRHHGVSVSTVVEAYIALENRGLIEGRPKSGFFVRSQLAGARKTGRATKPMTGGQIVAVGSLLSRLFDAARSPDVVPFGAAYPGTEVLPVAKLTRITAAVVRRDGAQAVGYDMPPGSEALRRQVAKRSLEWGTTLTPDEIITTCGGTEALALALRAVTKPGDVVAVESPTYFGILQLLEDLGLRALEIPMHPKTGMDLDALETGMRRGRVAACLAVPNFSNPLGSLMPDDHKRRLGEILRKKGVPLIEDDINGDLSHDGLRPRVVQAHDTDGLVMLCGSYSKTLAPGYRVGWIAPGRFYARVKALKLTSTLATASLPQLAVAEFLANGGYDHHLRALRRLFAAQVLRTREAIEVFFPKGTQVTNPSGGFVLWVELPGTVSALKLHERALLDQISVAPGPMFSATQRFPNFIRINCGHPWTDRREQALERLGALVRKSARQ
jgi:DNA-binding transcriptional MocR family regulator